MPFVNKKIVLPTENSTSCFKTEDNRNVTVDQVNKAAERGGPPGGIRQGICVAVTLALHPKFIILDETVPISDPGDTGKQAEKYNVCPAPLYNNEIRIKR